MNEPMSSFLQAALLAIMLARRYRPGHHYHNGFLQHGFATSPWLGAIVVAVIVLVGLVLALIKKAGCALEGIPWYVRLALLVTVGFGIFQMLGRKKQATPHGCLAPADRRSRPALSGPSFRRPARQARMCTTLGRRWWRGRIPRRPSSRAGWRSCWPAARPAWRR